VRLDDPTDPQINLRMASAGTLLTRNDSVVVRADSDIMIAGPFTTARVTGTLGLTKSQFFRDVDILPIGLPGRPAPKQRQGQFNVSIDVPPFRSWTLDVQVMTKEAFGVRGNMANGQA